MGLKVGPRVSRAYNLSHMAAFLSLPHSNPKTRAFALGHMRWEETVYSSLGEAVGNLQTG